MLLFLLLLIGTMLVTGMSNVAIGWTLIGLPLSLFVAAFIVALLQEFKK